MFLAVAGGSASTWTSVWIAGLAATPPTILAYATLIKARSTDRAVNHRAPRQPTLVQMVDKIATDVEALGTEIHDEHHGLRAIGQQMVAHRAWHQEQTELGLGEDRRSGEDRRG